jgi:hypothetical protein
MMKSKLLTQALATEFTTIAAMMEIYCAKHHSGAPLVEGHLCQECSDLLRYAEQKLDRCPYGQHKPACKQCPIHCYKPEPKEQVRLIMRYSGPRMLLLHPILAIRHLLHEKKPVPNKPEPNGSNRHRRHGKTQ